MSVGKISLEQNLAHPKFRDAVQPGFIRTQLANHSVIPPKFISSAGLNAQYSVEEAWKSLTTLEKICAYVRAFEFSRCGQGFPVWKSLALAEKGMTQIKSEQWEQQLRLFHTRMVNLIDPPISTPLLNYLDVLEIQIFTPFNQLFKLEQNYKAPGCIIENDRLKVIKTSEGLEIVHEKLVMAFILLKGTIEGNLIDFQAVEKSFKEIIVDFNLYYQSAHQSKTTLTVNPTLDKCTRIWDRLNLLLEALQAPLSFLPLLLRPLQSQTYDLGLESMRQRLHLHPSTESWLEQFVSFCKFETKSLLKYLKKLPPNEQIEPANFNNYLKEVQDYYQAISSLCKQYFSNIKISDSELLALYHKKEELLLKKEEISKKLDLKQKDVIFRGHFLQQFSIPHHQFFSLVYSLVSTLDYKQAARYKIGDILDYSEAPKILNDFITPSEVLTMVLIDTYDKLHISCHLDLSMQMPLSLILQNLHMMTSFLSTISQKRGKPQVLNYREKSESMEMSITALNGVHQIESLDISKYDDSIKNNFVFLKTFLEVMSELFTLDDWPLILAHYYTNKKTPISPKQVKNFLKSYFINIRYPFAATDFDSTKVSCLNILKTLLKDNAILREVLPDLGNIFSFYKDLQKVALNQITVDNFDDQALLFCECALEASSKIEISLHSIAEILENYLEAHPQAFNIDQILSVLKQLSTRLEDFAILPLRGILAYSRTVELERTRTTSSKKKEAASPKFLLRKPVVKTSAKINAPLEEKTLALEPKVKELPQPPKNAEELCQRIELLSQLHLGFTEIGKDTPRFVNLSSAEKNIRYSLAFIKEHLSNLELLGHHPSIVWDLTLRLAVLLEQIAYYAYGVLNLKAPEIIHEPVELLKDLCKRGLKVNLTDAQLNLLNDMKGTIAVTSRHPGLGPNPLSRQLSTLINLWNEKDATIKQTHAQKASKTLSEVLKLSFQVMEALSDQNQTSVEIPRKISFEKAFIPQIVPKASLDEMKVLDALSLILKDLQRERAFPANRALPHEMSLYRRLKTLSLALSDLRMLVNLMRDTLSLPADPSLCLTLGLSFLKLETSSLESVLLALLAHLPIHAEEDRRKHYLFSEKEGLKKDSHRLDEFYETLVPHLQKEGIYPAPDSLEGTKTRLMALTSFQKAFYRYNCHRDGQVVTCPLRPSVEQWMELSYLWDALLKGNLSDQELKHLDAHLKVTDMSQRDQKLATYIQNVMENHKMQLLETAQNVFEWLKVYQTLLLRAGKCDLEIA